MCLRGWREVPHREAGYSGAGHPTRQRKKRSMVCGVCLPVPLSDHPVLLAEVLQPKDRERMGSSGIWVLLTSLEGGREAAGTWKNICILGTEGG